MPKKAGLLLTNAILLSMDEDYNTYEPGALTIKGDSILAVGDEAEIKKEYIAKETIEFVDPIFVHLGTALAYAPCSILAHPKRQYSEK